MPNAAAARLTDQDVFQLLTKAREQYDAYVSNLPELSTILRASEVEARPKHDVDRPLGLVIQP